MSTRQCRVAKKGFAVLVATEHQKVIDAPDYTITNSVLTRLTQKASSLTTVPIKKV